MDTTEKVWRRDFANASEAIPLEWLVRTDDGFVGISPEHRQTKTVQLYHSLVLVGYARGWL